MRSDAAIVEIAGRKVGPGEPCFIVAEAGVNHNGDPETARRLVDAAAQAGADAVKFQTFQASRLVSPRAPKAEYQTAATAKEESQLEMLRRLELSAEAHGDLYAHCRRLGILFLSAPFDEESAEFLNQLGVAAFKIPSGEITNIPFLERVADFGKPMIVSTGMACLGEVEAALNAIHRRGCRELILLQCVSSYPTAPADANLAAMETLRRAFGVPVGYSDHTMGLEVSLAAVALGACVIEKHFTLDRSLPGPDQRASLEPAEWKALVEGIRNVEAALGHGRKEPAPSERNTAEVARKSLHAAVDIPCGGMLSAASVVAMRPGTGLPPAMLPYVIGRVARRPIAAGEILDWGAFE
jgi:N-acetylneuraminate synthase/N,N'-diacetyllegionaminate synthase